METARATSRANEGGLELVLEWLNQQPKARLVIIDVLGKFRPRESKQQRLYDLDYDAIAPIADVARQRGVCVLVMHHTNKLKADDPIDNVSGTTGLAGAADAICVFRRERGKIDASLLITGRDVEEQELAFKFVLNDQKGRAWDLVGEAAVVRMSAQRQEILAIVLAQPAITASGITAALGAKSSNVRQLLFHMVRDGNLRMHDGHYFSGFSTNIDNIDNAITDEIKNGPQPLSGPNNTDNSSPVIAVTTVSAVSTVTAVSTDSAHAQNENGAITAVPFLCSTCGTRRLLPHEYDRGTCTVCVRAPR